MDECEACGTPVPIDARSCPKCGLPLGVVDENLAATRTDIPSYADEETMPTKEWKVVLSPNDVSGFETWRIVEGEMTIGYIHLSQGGITVDWPFGKYERPWPPVKNIGQAINVLRSYLFERIYTGSLACHLYISQER
jgi:hypothetical protein